MTATIVTDVLDDSEAAEYINQTDPTVRAIGLLEAGEAFPKLPEKGKPGKKVANLFRVPQLLPQGRAAYAQTTGDAPSIYALCPRKVCFVKA
ncbi:MAG: hypothetical protein ACLS29_03360 [Prevotellamassilia sp.]